MDFNRIALFVKVIESGSISAAARNLGQSKSNLSRAIASLESELGVQLIYRNTRHLHPTETGQRLYGHCKNPMQEIAKAADFLRLGENALKGKLTITSAVDLATTTLPPLLHEFSKTYPELVVELRSEDEMIDLVKEGVDLALRFGRLPSTNLKASKISDISMILVASGSYLAGRSKIRSIADLTGHTFIGFAPFLERGVKLVRKGGATQKFTLTPRMIVNNPVIARELALLGSGISLVPGFLCYEALKNGTLIRVLPDYHSEMFPLSFVWPAHQEGSPKVRAFIEFSRDRLRKYFIG